MRTAALNRATSNTPSSRLNFIKFSDARLHAVLFRNTYSEHGLVEWIGSVPLHVCHFWTAPSYWRPGSPQIHVPCAIFSSSVEASFFCSGFSPITVFVHHSRPSSADCMNSSETRTDRFSFWYITLPYASPLYEPS